MTVSKDLSIAILGAGMGGLTCALALAKKGFTNIQVYESASNLGFVGAGIQLAPNMARILDNLGVWKDIEAEAVDLQSTSIRQGATDSELAFVDLKYIRSTYDYPHMVGHRASLAGGLYAGCQSYPDAIKFNFSTSGAGVESWGPKPIIKLQPRDGEAYTITPDVVLACDGIKSQVRDSMLELLKHDAKIVDTKQAAYRIVLDRKDMEHDPELLELIEGNRVTRWIGEKRHIIAYPVSSKQIYNLSTVQPDVNFASATNATYTTKGDKAVMMKTFDDFCPKVKKMLDMVPDGEVCEWKLRVHAPLPTWIHESVALVGDACHPTLPHLAQGAAQAIEDAAVLAEVLDMCPSKDAGDINKSLLVYEKVRKDRAETLVELAAASGRALHLGEGKAKEERDKAFQEAAKGGKVPDKWADADVQRQIYGFDCQAVTREKFAEVFAAA